MRLLNNFICLLPLLNFISLAAFGRYLGSSGSKRHTYTILALLNVIYLAFFFHNLDGDSVYISTVISNWINVGDFHLDGLFLLDGLSSLMCLLIIIVSSIVHIYSYYYMENDPNCIRFISYLSFFTFSMLLLVLSENLFIFFSAWEFVGIASYLLIGFWSTRREARKGALKAVILNRVGDCCIIAAMGLSYTYTGSNALHTIFSVLPYNESLDLITILFFIGCIAKSAQIFLHIWLLQAMEGATPVSALLHAATMVTAGVYFLARLSYIFEYTNMIFFPAICSITIFYAASAAILQNDLKKIIAYSTCSQLGYMLTACSLSGYNSGFFHLLTHGFFKALLFLSAGLVIHNLHEEQDIRKMGGLYNLLPITYTFFCIGSLAIIGFPFMAGFYSKDSVLEFIASHICTITTSSVFQSNSAILCTLLAYGGVVLTTFYSIRLLYYVFWCKPNGYKSYYHLNFGHEEAPKSVIFFLSILALCSIFTGYLFKPLLVGFGSSFLLFSCFTLYQPVVGGYNPDSNIFFVENLTETLRILPILLISYTILAYLWSSYQSAAQQRLPLLPMRAPLNTSYLELSQLSQWKLALTKITRRWYKLVLSGYYIDYYILSISMYCLKEFKKAFLVEKAFFEHYGPYGLRQYLWNPKARLTDVSFLHLNRDFQLYINTSTLIIFFTFSLFFFFLSL